MKSIKSTHIFLFGLALKCGLLFFFGSYYLRGLFIPFIDFAVQNPLSNPWSHFSPEHFPYGSVLYLLLFVPKFLAHLVFGEAALGQGPLSLAAMKLPLLALDTLLFWTLLQFSVKSLRPLLYMYWLNPVLIFITYIHGQLDVVTMCFTILGLLYLTGQRLEWSAVFMAAATLSKSHAIAIIPFIIVYLWKWDFAKYAIRDIAKWVLIWGGLTFAGFLPIVLADNLLYVTVGSPQASRIFGMQLAMGSGKALLFGIAVLFATLGRLCLSHRITPRGLVFGSGVLFGVLLLVTNPMPGWYYWVFPFLSLFYSTYHTNHRQIFWVLMASFLVYFGLSEMSFLNVPSLYQSIIFTVLQTSVAAALAEIWILVIQPEMPLQKIFKPLMIGIAGDSGVGKNTLSAILADILGESNSVILEGDDYHRWERAADEWEVYTHLNPRANHLPTLANHTLELMMGRFVMQRRYDHATGSFTTPQAISPNKTIIIQGLHALYLKDMREALDLKIFLSAEKMLQLAWKIKRDVNERRHTPEKIMDLMEKRSQDAAAHIAPQKNVADWHIEYRLSEPVTKADILKGKDPAWYVRFVVWNDAPWSLVTDALSKSGECEIDHEEIPGDIDRTAFSIKGEPRVETIERIAKSIFVNIRHITRSRREPRWRAGIAGVCQLMTLTLLQDKMLHDSIHKASS